MNQKLDFRLINDRALQSIDSVLNSWLPGGKRQGSEYVVANPARTDSRPGSFSINLNNGVWCDFATNDKGGDLIALVAYLDRTKNGEACKALGQFLGINPSIGPQTNTQQSAPSPPPKQRPPSPDFEPVRPVPASALKSCPTSIRNLGKPSMYWDYLGEDGKEILLRVMRFDNATANGRPKDYRPFCYGENKTGRVAWHSKAPTMNRPLYGLHKLATTPATANILLCEGEKATDAAQALFPDAVVMTWPSGSKAISKADFTPLRSRAVWYWPDNDKAGSDSIAPLRTILGVAGVASVTVLNINLFAKYQPNKTNPKPSLLNAKDSSHWPEKADAADATTLGWTADHIALLMERGLINAPAKKPPPQYYNDNEDDGPPKRFKTEPDGLYFYSPKHEQYHYIGGPLRVLARSRDKISEGWGLLVEFEDYDSQPKVWNIPSCFLVAEGGNKAVEGLVHRGYRVSSTREGKNQLKAFLGDYETTDRVRLINRIGWYGNDAFMLPNNVIGNPKESLHYYSDSADLCKIGTAGDLKDWTDNIGKYANKNIFMTFALSTAFAGPFIDIKDTELFGVHLFGDSSLGKTTLLEMAASVYGNPDKGEYTKTWRTTSNALEGMAAAHSDCLLVLDEIGQIEPRIVGETVYSLCSGVGKSRANETGSNRGNQHRWRICFLSSGEKTLADHMAEANQKPKAGQEVRLLAVSPCPHKDEDKRRHLGNFNDDHGFGGGAPLSEHLREQARKFYGTPFIALLESITKESREDLADYITTIRANFKFETLQSSASGQANRAADKFALIAAAGEYATKIGITGWEQGWATHAANHCFKDWIAQRGGDGNLEDKQALDHVREMLTKYGESRFSRMEGDGAKTDEHAPRTMERWGFRKTTTAFDSMEGDTSETVFYITPKSFGDLCKGFDKSRVADLLDKAGALIEKDKPEKNGTQRKTKKVRLPGGGKKSVSCYVIGLAQLLEDDEYVSDVKHRFDNIPGFD